MRPSTFLLYLACIAASLATSEATAAGDRAVTIEVSIVEVATDRAAAADDGAAGWTTERILALKPGDFDRVTRMRLSTVEEQVATVQHGEEVAVETGRSFGGGRAFQTVYQQTAVGTLVTVVPRIEADGAILLELSAEQSRLGERPAGGESDGADREAAPPPVVKLTTKGTLRVPNGETVVAHSSEASSGGKTVLRAVLVRAWTSDEDGANRAPAP